MITYYCPNCWIEISAQDKLCPNCGYNLSEHSHISIEQKLVMALRHPILDSRMMAVQILGNLGSVQALPEFEKILDDDSSDIYLLLEVIKALPKIHDPRSITLLQKACMHKSSMIRSSAKEQLMRLEQG
jgi:HEAT repeat protein